MKRLFRLLTVVLALVSLAQAAESSKDYADSVAAERADRSKRLQRDDGWLTLVGLHYLNPGENKVGSAPDNSVVFAAGPAHFGVVTLAENGTVTFAPAAGVATTIAGKAVTSPTVLPLGDDNPEAVIVRSGQVSFLLMERGGRKALRVKDNEAPRRKHFLGIDYFPTDPSWRIEATWVPFEKEQDVSITNVIGNTYIEKSPGKAVFTRDGITYELTPIIEEKGEPLFFIFSDETSGHASYAMRFLDGTPTPDGKIVLDFNLAENPPCAFTPFATCPRPPKGNHLKLAVTAGEKVYAGEHHE